MSVQFGFISQQRLCRTISILFDPVIVAILLVCAAVGLMAPPDHLSEIAAVLVILEVVAPAALLLWGIFSGKISGWTASRVSERGGLLLFACVMQAAGLGYLYLRGATALGRTGVVFALLCLLLYAITRFFQVKVSLHAAASAIGAAFVARFFGVTWGLSLLPLVFLVGWARVKLGEHSAGEVVLGGGLSLGIGVLLFSFG